MYIINGKISVKETGAPVSDVIVRLIIQSASKTIKRSNNSTSTGDSIGSVISDESGKFQFMVDGKTPQTTGKDQGISCYLVVEAPDDVPDNKTKRAKTSAELYVSKLLNIGIGNSESVIIRIPQSVIETHELGKTALTSLDLLSIAKINKEKFKNFKNINNDIEQKTEAGFKDFLLKATDKRPPNYYVPGSGDSLTTIQQNVIDVGLSRIPVSKLTQVFSTIVSTDNMRKIGISPGSTSHISVDTMMNTLFPDSSVQAAKKQCLHHITEDDIFPTQTNTTTPPVATNGQATTNGHAISREELMQFASKLISTTTSPETALEYKKIVDPTDKNGKVCDTLSGLTVCSGPADITSYYDFQTVQIAFEHIWTEVFNEKVKNLGKQLYSEVVKLEEGYSATAQARPLAQPVVANNNNTVFPSVSPPPAWVPALPATNTGTATAFAVGGGQVVVSPSSGATNVVIAPSLPIIPARPAQVNTINDLYDFIQQFKIPGYDIPTNIVELVNQLDKQLSERHRFDVFAPNSINYGLLYTFRQKWEPVNYQVGRLISSLPLAPKESRKYNIKTVKVVSRNQKMLDDQEFKSHSESSMTSRAENEIINRAQNKTSFNLSASVNYNGGAFGAQVQSQLGTESENLSSETKKNFREAVSKASQDFRKQNKTEIEVSSKIEQETTSTNEIMNPNDEIPVTFLFYELQRQYDISEELYKLQPVIFVANEVPTPDEIDLTWLIRNSWILQKVILDPMFLNAIYFLNENALSGTISLQVLRDNLNKQIELVQSLTYEANIKNSQAQMAFENLLKVVRRDSTVSSLDTNQLNNAMMALTAAMHPIGTIVGAIAANQADDERFKRMKEAASMLFDRQDKERSEFADRLKNEMSSLEKMTTAYVDEIKRVLDREQAVAQLRIHVKDNILYYMQAIWDHEPPDQRFFRLYNIEIDWLEPAEELAEVNSRADSNIENGQYIQVSMNYRCRRVKRKLVEVADLDDVLGYKGNYLIFAAKKRSHLHNYMMHDFIDEYTGGLKDPDGYAQYTTQELIDYLRCLRQNNPGQYEVEKTRIIEILNEKQKSPRKEKERIVLPTSSAYIEALPGKHAILEDFKMVHRALDVKKVQAEVRKMELENLRYASRLNKDELGDPDFEKQVLISKTDADVDVSDT